MMRASQQNRSIELDVLKGIAIIAVVLYHFAGSVLPYGYLGVEIFFVISGYLLMKSMLGSLESGQFSFFKQVSNRVLRLYPSMLAMFVLCFIFGYIFMLPDDFENLAQSTIASSAFSNNILAAITTKNYWDIVNLFKPLMHTWYLGVLVQGYVVIIGITAICNKIAKNKTVVLTWMFLLVSVVSLILYLMPAFSPAWKFYFIPFRLFEITIGSFIALVTTGKKQCQKPSLVTIAKVVCVLGVLALIGMNSTVLSAEVKLLTTVALTAVYTYLAILSPMSAVNVFKPLAFLGRNSYPIYITHQCVVAFFYYSFIPEATITAFLVFVLVVALFSLLIHFGIEKTVNHFIKAKKQVRLWIVCCLGAFLVCGASGLVYLNAGVVRDVPELDITVGDAKRGMHAAYCDIPFAWDKDFTDGDTVKVLVIGDSFGRDWANILNESSISEDIEISYVYTDSTYRERTLQRLDDADVVFLATSSQSGIPTFIQDNIPKDMLWIIGFKNYGNSNGYIYKSRFQSDYFQQTQTISDSVLEYNSRMKETYRDRYIDMLAVVLQGRNQVRVFTDDGRFISQDCRHLTKAGAQFYAVELDLDWIVQLGK